MIGSPFSRSLSKYFAWRNFPEDGKTKMFVNICENHSFRKEWEWIICGDGSHCWCREGAGTGINKDRSNVWRPDWQFGCDSYFPFICNPQTQIKSGLVTWRGRQISQINWKLWPFFLTVLQSKCYFDDTLFGAIYLSRSAVIFFFELLGRTPCFWK